MAQKTLVVVVGPTAIGKTAWSIALAREFQTAVVSSDSRQFYKEMKIGTAVPSSSELKAAPHYFIQHKSIHEPYTVGDFENEAMSLLEKLFQDNEVVILTGGSGLYINAVIKGLDRFPEIPHEIRQGVRSDFKEYGLSYLKEELEKKDPEYFAVVDRDNPHRLLRALEVCRTEKKPYSSYLTQGKAIRPFETVMIGITADREEIYKRINTRVEQMFANGLVQEAEQLYEYKSLPALQTVGFKELFTHFEGGFTLEEAKDEIAKNTRRYAKRQLTWFNNQMDIQWFQRDTDLKVVTSYIHSKIQ